MIKLEILALCRSLYVLSFIMFLIVSPLAYASKNVRGGMLDFNFYPYLSDVATDSVFTLNVAATLHSGFSYFSLTNFYNQSNDPELQETNTYYSEQNIRWRINKSAFDLTGQFNFRSGDSNDRHRLGIRWRLNDFQLFKPLFKNVNLAWSINFHLLQIDKTDANEWQMEHVFRLTFPEYNNRLYLAGFIDHTFSEDLAVNIPSNPIVGELQVGYRLLENLYFVAEYRVNQYRRSDVNNVGVGIEYKLLW